MFIHWIFEADKKKVNVKKQPLFKSFRFAINGIAHTFQNERNFRIHCAITVLVLGLSAWLKISPVEWCLILLCIGLVLAMELINTALEAIVDLASPEKTELARIAKDTAAAAVFCVSMISVVIGLIILLPPLMDHFKN